MNMNFFNSPLLFVFIYNLKILILQTQVGIDVEVLHQVNVKMIPFTLCNGSLPLPELWQLNSCVRAVVSRLRAATIQH